MSKIKHTPYPVEALPDSMKRAVLEHCSNNHTPPALAAMAAITAVSIAFQGGHNVRRPGGEARPLHLFTMAIAQPSERKSSVLRDFCRPIFEFQQEHAKANQLARAKYVSDERAWKGKERHLNSQIGSEYAKGNPTEELEARRRVLIQERPKPPFIVRQIYQDATFTSLMQGLYRDCPSAALLSSEGTIVFRNLRIEDCGKMCAISDGDPLEFSRKEENFSLRDVRLTVFIMTQIDSFRKFLEKGGGAIQEMGFLARLLVACPESEIGNRLMDDSLKSTARLDEFNERISSALAHHFRNDMRLSRVFETLELSEAASSLYRDFFNAIEGNLSESGKLYDVRDHASKIPEMALRMAALFHLMEECEGVIQPNLLQSAIDICTWHLFEYQRLFGKEAQISKGYSNRERIVKWLVDYFRKYGLQPIKKSAIYSIFPGDLRRKSVSGPILDDLCRDNIIYFHEMNGCVYIFLDHRYFSTLAGGQLPALPSPTYGLPYDPPMVRYGLGSPAPSAIFY